MSQKLEHRVGAVDTEARQAVSPEFVRPLNCFVKVSKPCGMYSVERSVMGVLVRQPLNLVRRLGQRIGNADELGIARLSPPRARQYGSSTSPIPSELRLLEGQVAVITGAASGIGAGTARLFSRHGARVVIADIRDSLGEKIAKECGPQAEYVHCDVRKEEDIIKTWERAFSLDNKLDIVFNNAGTGGTFCSIDGLDVEKFDAVMQVNLRAAVMGVKHAARLMKPNSKGSILCTGSIASVLGGIGPHAYSIAKSGVVALVRQAAAELKDHGIRVNAVSPAAVPTPIIWETIQATVREQGGELPKEMEEVVMKQSATMLKNRCMCVEDIANAALYLASDMGGMVSGHNLVVDVAMSTSGNPGSSKFSKDLLARSPTTQAN